MIPRIRAWLISGFESILAQSDSDILEFDAQSKLTPYIIKIYELILYQNLRVLELGIIRTRLIPCYQNMENIRVY